MSVSVNLPKRKPSIHLKNLQLLLMFLRKHIVWEQKYFNQMMNS